MVAKEGNSAPCPGNLAGGRTTVSETDSDFYGSWLGFFSRSWPGAGQADESAHKGLVSLGPWRKQRLQLLSGFLLGFPLFLKKEFQGMAALSAAGRPINKRMIKEKAAARCGGGGGGIRELMKLLVMKSGWVGDWALQLFFV